MKSKFEMWIGKLLRIGVMCSATLVLIGGIIYLLHNGSGTPQYRVFRGEMSHLTTIEEIGRGALTGDGLAVAQLGMLVLIATPIARVIFSAIGFLRERDFLYVFITLVVFCVLLYGLIGQR